MSAKFTLEGSSAGAVQAVQQVADAMDKAGQKAEGAAKSTKQLNAEAQRIKEALDPQEKLNRKYQELQQHVEAGRISINQATAAGIKYRQELYATSEEGKKAAAAALIAGEAAKKRAENDRKSLQIQLESGQRLLRLEKDRAAAASQAAKEQEQLAAAALKIRESISPQEKLNRLTLELATHVKAGRLSIDEATTAHRKYRQELGLAVAAGNEAAEATEDAFGSAATSQLLAYAAGIGSISAIVAAITGAFRDAETASQAAADSIFDALGAFVELQQLGREDFAKGAAISQRLVESGVVKPGNRTQATEIASNLINAEFTDKEIDFITNDLAKIVNAENLTGVGGDLKKLSRSFGEGDIENLSDRVLAAANITQADLAQTSREVLKFSQLAASSGINTDQALAAFVVSEGLSASPEAAAEAQKSLFSQIKRRGLAGDDLFSTLDNIQKAIPKGGTAFDVLHDANAVIGFENLQGNRQRLREVEATIQAAGGSVTAGGDLINQDPSLRAARLRARAEGKSSVATENASSEAENLFNAMRSELNARGAENNEWALTRWLRNKDLDAADAAGIEADAMRAELTQGFLTGSRVSPDLSAAMEDYLKRIEENTGETKQAVRSKVATRPE
jgi:hypothetical protein